MSLSFSRKRDKRPYGQRCLEQPWEMETFVKRAALFTTSPTTQDLIDAVHQNHTILIEDTHLKQGLMGFEAPPGELALSLTTLTAYIIDIIAVLEYFLLHKTKLHPVLCQQILTSTHEVVTNAILWSNLEVECLDNRQKSLNFSDLIRDKLSNKTLAKRLIKINFHIRPTYTEVVIISSGNKGFDWNHAISKVSSQIQGLAIIKSFVDEIVTYEDGKVLCLRFYT